MNWFNKIDLNYLVSQKMTLLFVIDQIPLSEAQRNDLQGIVHLLDSLQDVCESQAAPAVPEQAATRSQLAIGRDAIECEKGQSHKAGYKQGYQQGRADAAKAAPAVPQGFDAFKAKADEVFGFVVGLGGYGDAIRALYAFAAPSQEPAVPRGEPVACLVRWRRLRTAARNAHDGQDHFSEWSDWRPETLKYGMAVTDPSRNSGPEHLFEMLPLVLATPAAPSQPVTLTEHEVGDCIDKTNRESQYGLWQFGWSKDLAANIIAALREKEKP